MASSVFSRAAGLGALTAAGQLIIIGSLPTYSRVFDPAAYGQYLIFVGAVGIVSVFAGLRYDSAIVLPRDDRIASRLSALVMLIALAVAIAIACATLLAQAFEWTPAGWMVFERDLGYGLAAATTIGAAQRCLSSWCIRANRFFLMGLGLFIFALMTVVAQLAFVRVMGQLPALVWGYVCALGFQSACLATLTGRLDRRRWVRVASFRGLKISLLGNTADFQDTWSGYALASSARDRLMQIMLGIGAGAAVVGRFGTGLSGRVCTKLVDLQRKTAGNVFSIASRGTPAAVGPFSAGLVEATFVVMVVPYVAFAIEAPAMTDGLLSYKWHGTGPFLQALAGPALLLAATCWLDRAFDSFRRQKVAFTLEASFTTISVVLVAFLSRYVGAVTVAWAFGILAIIYYWTYFLMTFVACAFPLADFSRACVTGLLALAGALSLGILAHQIPVLPLRLPSYAVVTAMVILWCGCPGSRGGADACGCCSPAFAHMTLPASTAGCAHRQPPEPCNSDAE